MDLFSSLFFNWDSELSISVFLGVTCDTLKQGQRSSWDCKIEPMFIFLIQEVILGNMIWLSTKTNESVLVKSCKTNNASIIVYPKIDCVKSELNEVGHWLLVFLPNLSKLRKVGISYFILTESQWLHIPNFLPFFLFLAHLQRLLWYFSEKSITQIQQESSSTLWINFYCYF